MVLLGDKVALEFASINDKRLIYDMLVSPEVKDLMFDDDHPVPSWHEFDEDESNEFFTSSPSTTGSYLLIRYDDEIIGSISYANSFQKITHSEIDIWISDTKHTGQGLGTDAINLLTDFVHKNFSTDTFIIRPWIKNVRAIRAYKKCGFEEIANFNPNDFYTEEDALEYGDGDYGVDETANLIKRYNKTQ